MTTKVRQSKFRHLFGEPWPATECSNSAKVGALQIEANVLKVNPKWVAYPGIVKGTINVIPLTNKGAIDAEAPVLVHEENVVNEFNFSPFDDNLLVSGLQDGKAAVWKIPEGGLTQNLTSPVSQFSAHEKRIMNIEFHPLANNVLVTIDAGKEVKLWDLEQQSHKLTLPDVHKAALTNISWNGQGNLLATSAKDKKLRVFDPRANQVVGEADDHGGSKGSRVLWLTNKDKIFSVGFSKTSDRHYSLHDPRNLSKPLLNQKIDSSPSTLLPFYDEDLSILYLAGKGDANVRYYEVVDEDPYIHFLNEYKSKDPQTGFAPLPKRIVDVRKCEVVRFYKLTPQGQIIPLRFVVPRQDFGVFQDDIFPNAVDGKPAASASEWFSGANKALSRKSLDPGKQ